MIEAVIFDFGKTLYNPAEADLFPETISVLSELVGLRIRLALVTIAVNSQLRLEELVRFGIKDYFSIIDILDLKQEKDFTRVIDGLKAKPQSCVVIGDNLKREITKGNKVGAYTVWTRQGLVKPKLPQSDLEAPRVTIDRLQELLPIVRTLLSSGPPQH